MNNVTYRLAREDDLSALRLIQTKALQHLVVTGEGRDPSAMPITDEPSLSMRHLLHTDPKLAWVATRDGDLIGFSVGFVRGELWFLSDLFVLPEAHGQGVGGELLQRCLAGGEERGARIRAVESSSDRGAQALYIRAGMVPRFPLFNLKGASRNLRDLPPVRSQLARSISSQASIRQLGDLDEIVWGRRRDGEHRFWLGEFAMTRLAIADVSGGLLAYAYYEPHRNGARRIGPLAACNARLQLALLRAIGDAIGDGTEESVELQLPGINATALNALLGAGFRIDHVGLFMSSRTFGRFDRYLPSDGTLL
ncbi:MAG: GNAT family N-acetyltransferase [Candidatus Binataceae bacterium]